ncbi:BZ3500_MvSof-1268-A1-R1_Chr3-3g06537 [Microbotryum saponariae]|uniref:BZ3500_MvSof-1268-A1-R1_Chr3-3g06537 protein n=1 Tax=Microbotryum saponariae TaxID=289078 RepID=A0A2X0LC17_9BASI|nr:BZ3500_MvSof-1268-A1-R1_Chr3-3g06537 [Microbotryum saponariae]SDA04504.1 BZ3501_MvSof-1269-A2-R1_Chr3-2g06224 [Microbotryum saponariae]
MKFSARVQVLLLLGALQTLVSATAAPQVDSVTVERSLESVPSTELVEKRTFLVGADPASAVLATAGGVVGTALNTAGNIVNGVLGGVLGGPTVVGPSVNIDANAGAYVGGGPYVSSGPGSSYSSYESQSYGAGPDCKKKFVKVRRTGQVEEVESA